MLKKIVIAAVMLASATATLALPFNTVDIAITRSGKVTGTFAGRPVDYVMGVNDSTQLAVAHKALNAAQ